MDARGALKKLADRKEQEIQTLRLQLAQAEAYLQAIQDSMRVLPRAEENRPDSSILREGTAIAQARDVLKAAGRPLHILEILKRMGRNPDKDGRVSLSGSLAAYVRRNQVFRKAGPNTFALIEDRAFGDENTSSAENSIPTAFGSLVTAPEVLSHHRITQLKSENPTPERHRINEIGRIQESTAQALEGAGHGSAAQLIRTALWSRSDDGFHIQVPGIGRKMLALTVNAAAEKIIRDALANIGQSNQFSLLSEVNLMSSPPNPKIS